MKYVLWGTYCDNAIEKRSPYRQQHLEELQRQKEAGVLVTLGPTEDSSHVFGIYEAESREQVEELLHNNIYWLQGIWTEIRVYPWIQAF
jgi:hypothetical protein